MIKAVIRDKKSQSSFWVEFNNEKITYEALVPGQRDFIVAMITTAMEENEISLKKNKGINCPINHNLKAKEEKEGDDSETKPSKTSK